jgi:hypothetical protein
MLAGRDCFVITATGSGKTFCYQSVLLQQPDAIMAVICPLITLMDDQVAAAKRLGIPAVALHADALSNDEHIIAQVAQGTYRLVLLAPEFCTPGNSYWMRLTEDCAFSRHLIGITIDEAHLCHAWRDFRPQVDGLYRLRAWFKVPLMVLSATMTPYVRQYVHSGLRLPGHIPLIQGKIDRPEIYLATRIITHPVASHQDLDFLFPEGADIDDLIPTIVFVDCRKDVSNLCSDFWQKAPLDWYRRNPFTFSELSTGISQDRRMLILKAMRAGLVKVLFATQIAEVGLDFGTVCRVIQWRVPLTLSGAGLWQRFGRACRRRNMVGVGLLFVAQTARLPDNRHHPLAILKTSPQDTSVGRVLHLIQAFDSGSKRKDRQSVSSTASSLPLLSAMPPPPYEVNPVVDTARQVRKRCRRAEPPTSMRLYDDILNSSSSESEDEDFNIPRADDSSATESDTLSESTEDINSDFDDTLSSVRLTPPGHNRSLSPCPRLSQQSLDLDNPDMVYADDGETSTKRSTTPMICRLILWIINTPGCIRECFLRYFDESGFVAANYRLHRLPEHGQMPCCDRHTPFETLPLEYARMMPEYLHTNSEHPDSTSGSPGNVANHSTSCGHARHSSLPTPSREQSLAIEASLRSFRRTVWSELKLGGQFSLYSSYKFLSDDRIRMLTKKSGLIFAGDVSPLTALKLPATDGLQPYEHAITAAINQAWMATPVDITTAEQRSRPSDTDLCFHADLGNPEVQQVQAIVNASQSQDQTHHPLGLSKPSRLDKSIPISGGQSFYPALAVELFFERNKLSGNRQAHTQIS